MSKTVNNLVEHLNKYKDAIVIVGPKALEDSYDFNMEDFNENYNRKSLVRSPEQMWDFFTNNMYKQIDGYTNDLYTEISRLNDVVGIVVDQNINSPMINNKIELHGSVHTFKCTKCKTIYPAQYVYDSSDEITTDCELCGAAIRPTVLLSGERYDAVDFNKVQESFAKSHTVILIGVDFTEEPILKLIAEFGDRRSIVNSNDGEEELMMVCIKSSTEDFDPNELCFFEFVVDGDVKSSLERLNGAF